LPQLAGLVHVYNGEGEPEGLAYTDVGEEEGPNGPVFHILWNGRIVQEPQQLLGIAADNVVKDKFRHANFVHLVFDPHCVGSKGSSSSSSSSMESSGRTQALKTLVTPWSGTLLAIVECVLFELSVSPRFLWFDFTLFTVQSAIFHHS
jgi:hypothetical protein